MEKLIKNTYKNIIEKVNNLLETNCLREPPIIARGIAMNCGLKVIFVDFNSLSNFQNVSGFIDSRTNTMYVNANESPKRQNFTIAHELGHFILDHMQSTEYEMLYRNSNCNQSNSQLEKEANFFAANLLVPEIYLKKAIKDYPYVNDSELSNIFGVSKDVIRNRRQQIGV